MLKSYHVKILFFLFLAASLQHAGAAFNSEYLSGWACRGKGCLGLDLTVYGGQIQGDSEEIVYGDYTGSTTTLSKLDWKIKDLWVVGTNLHKSFLDCKLHIYLDGWTKFHADRSMMMDRDYLDAENPFALTDISRSPDTRLESAKSYDISAEYDFYRFCFKGSSELTLSFGAGYKYLRLFWKSYGGCYSYNYGEDEGEFPDELGISYKQNFYIPYAAVRAVFQRNNFSLSGFAKYSSFARVKDRDYHAMRDLTFIDTFDHAEYTIFGGEASLLFCERFKVFAGYSYNNLNTVKGDMKVGEYDESYSGAAGVSHHHHLVSFGLTACF